MRGQSGFGRHRLRRTVRRPTATDTAQSQCVALYMGSSRGNLDITGSASRFVTGSSPQHRIHRTTQTLTISIHDECPRHRGTRCVHHTSCRQEARRPVFGPSTQVMDPTTWRTHHNLPHGQSNPLSSKHHVQDAFQLA